MELLKRFLQAQALVGACSAAARPSPAEAPPAAANILRPVRARSYQPDQAFAPSTNVSLPWRDQNGTTSAVVQATMKKPAVVLETLPSLDGVSCPGGNASSAVVVIRFGDAGALEQGRESWRLNGTGSLLLITSDEHQGCSDSHDRTVFSVGSIEYDTGELTATASVEKHWFRDEMADVVIDFSRRRETGGTPTSGGNISTSTVASGAAWPEISKTLEVDVSNHSLVDTPDLAVRLNEASVRATVQLSGHVHYNPLLARLEEFRVELELDMDASLDVAARVDGRLAVTPVRYSPLSVTLSAVKIPGIIDVGPMASLTLGLEVAAEGPVNATASCGAVVDGARARLDLLDPDDSSASGWEAATRGAAQASAQVELQLNPFADLTVAVGARLFEGLAELSAGLSARAALVNAFAVGRDFGFDSDTGVEVGPPAECAGGEDCCPGGAWYESRFWFGVVAFVTGLYRKPLYTYEVPMTEAQCWELGA
ncbi:hypothetical protein RB595_000108 [Gaeumannomyces hyphopodioides]